MRLAVETATLHQMATDRVVTPSSVTGAGAAPARAENRPDLSSRLTFLYKSLEDNQALIRFLDTKAAFAVLLLSAMIGWVISHISEHAVLAGVGIWSYLFLLSFGLSVAISLLLVALIVFPAINPVRNISLSSNPTPPFFLSELQPRKWQRFFSRNARYSRLGQEHSAYVAEMRGATDSDLLGVLAGEVLKVSYIRQIKADRFKALAAMLAISVILFVLLVFVFPAPSTNTQQPVAVHLLDSGQTSASSVKPPVSLPTPPSARSEPSQNGDTLKTAGANPSKHP